MYQQEWRQYQSAVSYNTQHVAQFATCFIVNDYHIRALAWGGLAYFHQFLTVEIATLAQCWHAFGFGVYGSNQLAHTAKIDIFRHELHEFHEFFSFKIFFRVNSRNSCQNITIFAQKLGRI